MSLKELPIAVIGAGPVGLAAAAHLLERNITPIIFERGERVGANVSSWAHVRMFSPWEFTVDTASKRLLEKHGWQMPPLNDLPTGGDLVGKYLAPLASLPEISEHLILDAHVAGIGRRDIDKMKDTGRDEAPFVLHIVHKDGQESFIEARAVIDASGTWHNPNPLGAGGLPAIGENKNKKYITYGIPDVTGDAQNRYKNQRVLVVGSGHSALNVLLELARLKQNYPQTTIYWMMRNANLQRVFGGGSNDALPARGALGIRLKEAIDKEWIEILAPYWIREIQATGQGGIALIAEGNDGLQTFIVDEIITATGARPDLQMLRELRLDIDSSLESVSSLAPMIDPNIHSCGTVCAHGEAELRHQEKNFYIVGMKSYGRAPTFLLATGYEQVRSIVAGLAGDWESAREVQLNLPETGVCSTDFATEGVACCGAPSAVVDLSAIQINGDFLPGKNDDKTTIETTQHCC